MPTMRRGTLAMTFPTSDSIIYRNEEGEVLGWDRPSDPMDYYCDTCGFPHAGPCPDEDEDEDPDDDSCHCGHPDCGAC